MGGDATYGIWQNGRYVARGAWHLEGENSAVAYGK